MHAFIKEITTESIKKKIYFCIAVFLIPAYSCFAQLNITPTTNAQLLAQKLVGPGIAISNATFTGAAGMAGIYNGHTSMGIDTGILLTNGLAINAMGPNNVGNIGYDWSTAGDADLANAFGTPVSSLYDACALEFDMRVAGDSLVFTYVFGSEEYPEFACSMFSDEFAILIKGPGITGYKNLGVVPGTNTPVSINTVNTGPGVNNFGYSCPPTTYPQYYVDNGDGSNAPYDASAYYIQYDGFTTILNASIGGLDACSTYHVKVVIADAKDGSYDSGIFLKSGVSVFGRPGTALVGTTYTTDSISNVAIAGCSDGIVPIRLAQPATSDTTIYFSISGTAVNGTDYITIADSVTFMAGDSVKNVIITPLFSSYTGLRYVYISVPYQCAVPGDTLYISNKVNVAITPQNAVICQGQTVTLQASANLNNYLWSPSQSLSDSAVADPVARPAVTTTYVCTSSYNGCVGSDSAVVTVIPYSHRVMFGIPYTSTAPANVAVAACSYGIIPVRILPPALADTIVHFVIGGTATNGRDYISIADSVKFNAGDSVVNVKIQPMSTGDIAIKTVMLSIDAPCGPLNSDQLNITNSFYADVNPKDTAICPGQVVWLFSNSNGGSYNWSPLTGLTNSNSMYTEASPDSTTTYVYTVSVGTCILSDSAHITVIYPCPLSIASLNSVATQFEIFPNPATDNLDIKMLSGYIRSFDISILNLQGQVLKRLHNVNTTEIWIDISDLASGLYIVTLNSSESAESKQLVKF